jgi:hypothetical protein
MNPTTTRGPEKFLAWTDEDIEMAKGHTGLLDLRRVPDKPTLLYSPGARKYFKLVETTMHWQYDSEAFMNDAAEPKRAS